MANKEKSIHKFIKIFRREHKELAKRLKRCQELDISRKKNRRQVKGVLKDLRKHLQQETVHVSPLLAPLAMEDPKLGRFLKKTRQELRDVNLFTDYMYDKYRRKDATIGYPEDIERMVEIFTRRVDIEERILFKRFKKEGNS
ncbi:MAG: hemerythrin domain-containing protein [Magnetococcales bacterium]|nr:hemerythrin domain-containing protein [Magnetococcales bacterium]